MRRMWVKLAESHESAEVGATEQLLDSFKVYNTNEEFLNSLPGAGSDNGSSARFYS